MSKTTAISTVTGEEVQYLIAKLDRVFANWPVDPALRLEDLSHKEEIPAACTASTQQQRSHPPKHLKQVESICGHLKCAGLLGSEITYCEMGCGTAKLSDFVSQTLEGKSRHILVDRKTTFSNTRMRDHAIRARSTRSSSIAATATAGEEDCVKRLTMDIREIDSLSNLVDRSSNNNNNNSDDGLNHNPLVAISKHLCGPAADFSIRSCIPSRAPLVVATCCHYLCEWDTFGAANAMSKLGFTRRDFEVLTIVSQWASIDVGKKKKKKKKQQQREQQQTKKKRNLEELQSQNKDNCSRSSISSSGGSAFQRLPEPPDLPELVEVENMMASSEFERTFARDAKAKLGKRCKHLLDLVRALQLQEARYSVKLVKYTAMSMEDHLLVAVPSEFKRR